MPPRRSFRSLIPLVLVAVASLGVHQCPQPSHEAGLGLPFFRFEAPLFRQLSLLGDLDFRLRVPRFARMGHLEIRLDGTPLAPGDYARDDRRHVVGALPGLAEGRHTLEAELELRFFFMHFVVEAATRFELVDLQNPAECEILNDTECLLPYPSSRFLEAADTVTGVRVAFPESGMPRMVVGNLLNFLNGVRSRIDPTPYNQHDGFSPTVQILMHFPGGVDVDLSHAPRLQPDTRTFDRRSLDRGSPTVLLDVDTGRRIPHFIENDARAEGNPERQMTILRPLRSLTPGHRYIVAIRRLVDASGERLHAEAPFAALRDHRPTDIPGLEARREHFDDLFHHLRRAGVRRHGLQLAFDFVVQSDEQLTGEMLSMRDQAFDWLAAHDDGATTFEVDSVDLVNPDCADPDQPVWKDVRGTYQVPLFLENDPFAAPAVAALLQLDAGGVPLFTTTTRAPFGIIIPCLALEGPLNPLVIGHGLFGTGPGTVSGLASAPALADFDYIAGATNWSGLSGPDAPSLGDLPAEFPEDPLSDPEFIAALLTVLQSFIGQILMDFDQFPAMGDRLRQGQLNTLVLARMLTTGAFNANEAFQLPGGDGVIAVDSHAETFYFGASLGGIMGLMFAALTPDVTNLNVDVPAINFSFLLQRATPFLPFDLFLNAIDPDPMIHVLGLQIVHEHWVRGEPAGYATHITRHPLPHTNAKNVLMTVAHLDQQVSNLGAEIAGNTLGLPNLVGSLMPDLALMEDDEGPLSSAYVVYDTASFDLTNPDHLPFVPPLTNQQAAPNHCDPHGRRAFIPASVEQLLTFLRPDGEIENFCDGLCDGAIPFERPSGEDPCIP